MKKSYKLLTSGALITTLGLSGGFASHSAFADEITDADAPSEIVPGDAVDADPVESEDGDAQNVPEAEPEQPEETEQPEAQPEESEQPDAPEAEEEEEEEEETPEVEPQPEESEQSEGEETPEVAPQPEPTPQPEQTPQQPEVAPQPVQPQEPQQANADTGNNVSDDNVATPQADTNSVSNVVATQQNNVAPSETASQPVQPQEPQQANTDIDNNVSGDNVATPQQQTQNNQVNTNENSTPINNAQNNQVAGNDVPVPTQAPTNNNNVVEDETPTSNDAVKNIKSKNKEKAKHKDLPHSGQTEDNSGLLTGGILASLMGTTLALFGINKRRKKQ